VRVGIFLVQNDLVGEDVSSELTEWVSGYFLLDIQICFYLHYYSNDLLVIILNQFKNTKLGTCRKFDLIDHLDSTQGSLAVSRSNWINCKKSMYSEHSIQVYFMMPKLQSI
jgi:hypothetical protein